MAIRMVRCVERFGDGVIDQSIGLIITLALLVLHDGALCIELGLRHRAKQMAHAIGLHEQRQIDRARGQRLDIVGAVIPGGAVVRSARGAQRLIEIRHILRSAEHQMLEEMRKTGLALGLILGADAVIDRDADDRRLAIRMDEDAQAIAQRELLIWDVHRLHETGERGGLGSGRLGGNGHGRHAGHGQSGQCAADGETAELGRHESLPEECGARPAQEGVLRRRIVRRPPSAICFAHVSYTSERPKSCDGR